MRVSHTRGAVVSSWMVAERTGQQANQTKATNPGGGGWWRWCCCCAVWLHFGFPAHSPFSSSFFLHLSSSLCGCLVSAICVCFCDRCWLLVVACCCLLFWPWIFFFFFPSPSGFDDECNGFAGKHGETSQSGGMRRPVNEPQESSRCHGAPAKTQENITKKHTVLSTESKKGCSKCLARLCHTW